MDLDERHLAYIEQTGAGLERMGLSRPIGRLIALLMIADEPVSLGELSHRLRISKAAVSNTVRLYRELGLLHRVRRPGDRRDYYEIAAGSLQNIVTGWLHSIDAFTELIDRGLEIAGPDRSAATERLRELQAFYLFVGTQLAGLQDEWINRRHHILAELPNS